jgi:alpha-glucuronidase
MRLSVLRKPIVVTVSENWTGKQIQQHQLCSFGKFSSKFGLN